MKNFDKIYESIMNEMRTVDNSHILKELNKTLNAFEEISENLSVEDAKDYVKYFTNDIEKLEDILDGYAKGGSMLTRGIKSAINKLVTLSDDLDDDDDIPDSKDILKTFQDEFNKLKKETQTMQAM